MADTSRLVKMRVRNLGCIGPEGCEVALNNILCLVGANNSGKSTILRAYELARGTEVFDTKTDPCRRGGNASATVEIWVHIPEATPNIAEKWIERDGELRLVRSKWEWRYETGWTKTRSTWDPELGDYSTDDKASGLDTVFDSRLPVPFRIGSLDAPEEEHKKLLTIVLQPIAESLKKQMDDANSALRKSIAAVTNLAKAPVDEERSRLNELKDQLNRSHNAIFPDLKIHFDIGLGDVEINPLQMLLKNSRLAFQEWRDEVSWTQQGTGSQRAMFWAMLQVRSRLKTIADIAEQQRKTTGELQKRVKRLREEAEKAKKDGTKQSKLKEILDLEQEIDAIARSKVEDQIVKQSKELSLPGYMLLIDEPEIALHPNAIRAASQYLYTLSDDPAWQVIVATHSPLFIDPLHDHTTIVRLARSEVNPTPKTFRSDSVAFSKSQKENLKILNRFDQGLAEMFFGQLPVLVEGDTEYAVFDLLMHRSPDLFPVNQRPVLVRARGKHTMLLIMKILREFQVPFAILHDADTPFCRNGQANGAWDANQEIYKAIQDIRHCGVRVVHRISIPNFECAYLGMPDSMSSGLDEGNLKDKPWRAVKAIREEETVAHSISSLLADLIAPDVEQAVYADNFEKRLLEDVQQWGRKHSPNDPRFGAK